MFRETIAGSDNVSMEIRVTDGSLSFANRLPSLLDRDQTIFIALRTGREIGAAVLPFGQHAEGSTVFLPFNADLLLAAEIRTGEATLFIRRWKDWRWSEREQTKMFEATLGDGELLVRIPRSLLEDIGPIDFAIYAKDPRANDGWGWLWGCSDATNDGGIGDKYIRHYHRLDFAGESLVFRTRHGAEDRARIYQLFVRLFGNTNNTRKQNGSLAENGVGKFVDINDAALGSIREMGFTHVWLTGVLQQATATDYSEFGQPADDHDLLKGLAGSPYAIKDYFDVCPDYALNPAKRLEEFQELLRRIQRHGLKAIIDLVPNHVARSYQSCIKPDCNFGTCGGDAGAGDDPAKFFSPHNNFFYLTPDSNGPPLRLPTFREGVALSPTCQLPGAQCDGMFEGETKFGRVTGNNCVSWSPQLSDWYETIKLNYGFDFTDPGKAVREFPNAWTPDKPVPDTWKKIDQVIEHWQSLGVDGFRCDMAHLVPPEMWSWNIARARQRDPGVFFLGEAYNDDPSKVPSSDPILPHLNGGHGNVLFDLLNAGFNAVYDAPVYRALKRIYDGSGWANDIDREIADEFICHNSVRYAENHDEVRLAARAEWGGVGLNVGRPVAAILYGLSPGAVMLYNGQEVGEPADGVEGFGGDDARTTIFDYWSMPEFAKWVNDHRYDGGRLSSRQKALREFYSQLIHLVGEPAFRDGKFFPLNPANHDNPTFGRLPGEQASGHWLYAFLRYDMGSGQRFLVAANLHPTIAMRDVRIHLSQDALEFLNLARHWNGNLIEHLHGADYFSARVLSSEVLIEEMPALSACYLEFDSIASGPVSGENA